MQAAQLGHAFDQLGLVHNRVAAVQLRVMLTEPHIDQQAVEETTAALNKGAAGSRRSVRPA